MHEERPWGSFTVLDEGETFKVKRIEVLPQKRLSYQKHAKRCEHWMVVAGTARVTLDGVEMTVTTGGVVDIPVGAAHRIENVGAETMGGSNRNIDHTSGRHCHFHTVQGD